MSSDEGALSKLVDRDLPWPTHMEFVASRDRVLDQLRATPGHRHALASGDASPNHFSPRAWALAVAAALVIVAVGGAIVWPRGVRVYAAGNDGLEVTLADGSGANVQSRSVRVSLSECSAHTACALAITSRSAACPVKSSISAWYDCT